MPYLSTIKWFINQNLTLKAEILKYLCYFDIFSHPLRLSELAQLSGLDDSDVTRELNALVAQEVCFSLGEFYAIRPHVSTLVEERERKEKKAKKYFDKLPSYARLIRSFPFVKGIAISGSLSKNVMHEDGDIDYFIITDKGRLWICRTFLVAFKKIFLFNSKKYFCVNYFVDEENLQIPDENIFTAIEIQYLLAVYNTALIDEFREANSWFKGYVSPFEQNIKVKEVKGKSWIGRFLQFIFKARLGDRFDLYLMKYTYKRWEKKFKHFDAKKFDLTMRTNRGVSKHHPRDFQNKVLKEFKERMEKLELETKFVEQK